MNQPQTYTGSRGRKALTDAQRAAKSVASFAGAPMRAPAELPQPPDDLSELAREEWLRVGEYLLGTERVAAIDYQSLTVYCASVCTFTQSIQHILADHTPLWGLVGGDNPKPKRSVFADIAENAGWSVIDLARKFGMTARTRHLDFRRTGRPALPDEIHALRGTTPRHPRKRSGQTKLIAWPAHAVAAPAWMLDCPAALHQWDRLVEQLTALDLWTPLDHGPALVASASFALALKATRTMNEEGLAIQMEEEAAVAHPALRIRSGHFDLCQRVWEDYGMTPYDRNNFTRMDADPTDSFTKAAWTPQLVLRNA
jgi:phage terminase small subunit